MCDELWVAHKWLLVLTYYHLFREIVSMVTGLTEALFMLFFVMLCIAEAENEAR